MNEQEKIRELESTIEDLTRHLQIEEQIARMGDRTPYRELESDLASERAKRVEAEATLLQVTKIAARIAKDKDDGVDILGEVREFLYALPVTPVLARHEADFLRRAADFLFDSPSYTDTSAAERMCELADEIDKGNEL